MQLIEGPAPVPAALRGAVLAIGNFDGVHRGHQALLSDVRATADALGVPAGVMVFEPHPLAFFRPDLPHFRLTPRDRQMRLFQQLGLDLAVVQRFDAALSRLSARGFVEDILVAQLGARHVVIGYDFHFGYRRSGTPDAMDQFGKELGFGVTIVPKVSADGAVFSSSAIRELLADGHVARANLLLGHRWRISGPVIDGAKRGTGLGFPTANVAMPAGTRLGYGIYAVWVHIDGERHDGAAYFGTRPQFDNGAPVLEVFLFDFAGDLYGRDIGVSFVEFIRADGAFEGIEALKKQMENDCARARDLLAATVKADPLAGLPLSGA